VEGIIKWAVAQDNKKEVGIEGMGMGMGMGMGIGMAYWGIW